MNYYEKIQKAIDYMETVLEENITVENVADKSKMSVSNFHRMFFAITGYQVKEYIRRRRISLAANDIKQENMRMIDIGMKYAYDSADSFSRAFKSVVGILPSKYKDADIDFVFDKIDVLENYFSKTDAETEKQYPDIKVLKHMEEQRAVYFQYYGKDPETHALSALSAWVLKNEIDLKNNRYRIFGYNMPDTEPGQEEYGFEVCVTIPRDFIIQEKNIQEKILNGGLYAVMGVESKDCLGEEIVKGWQRFQKWLSGSKYVYGNRQWMEEHLGFSDMAEHIGSVDLYMPIMLKSELKFEEMEIILDEEAVVCCTKTGANAQKEAFAQIISWAGKNNISLTDRTHKLFSTYNFEKIGTKDFTYTLSLTISDDMLVSEEGFEKKIFDGGFYLKRETNYKSNANSWYDFIGNIQKHRKYCFGEQSFVEEYLLDSNKLTAETTVNQYMPIVEKQKIEIG